MGPMPAFTFEVPPMRCVDGSVVGVQRRSRQVAGHVRLVRSQHGGQPRDNLRVRSLAVDTTVCVLTSPLHHYHSIETPTEMRGWCSGMAELWPLAGAAATFVVSVGSAPSATSYKHGREELQTCGSRAAPPYYDVAADGRITSAHHYDGRIGNAQCERWCSASSVCVP